MLTKEEEEKRLNLYNKGLCDKDIALKVGVRTSTITFWRRDRRLKSNGERRRGSYVSSYFTSKMLET